MPENNLVGTSQCPFVPLDSGAVTNISRGERLRRARVRRRLSRRELADTLQIDPKTIARIERDQVHRSPNIERLEEYLHDYLDDPTTETAEPTPDIAPPDPGPTLAEAHDLQLVAELARRLAARRENDEHGDTGQTGYFRWPTAALPHPEQGGPTTTSKRRVADGGTAE
jgi:transcriptional regulator with XRE-family HTH domain